MGLPILLTILFSKHSFFRLTDDIALANVYVILGLVWIIHGSYRGCFTRVTDLKKAKIFFDDKKHEKQTENQTDDVKNNDEVIIDKENKALTKENIQVETIDHTKTISSNGVH